MDELDWEEVEEIRRLNTEVRPRECLRCRQTFLTTRTHRLCAACTDAVRNVSPREINFTDLEQDVRNFSTEQARTPVG